MQAKIVIICPAMPSPPAVLASSGAPQLYECFPFVHSHMESFSQATLSTLSTQANMSENQIILIETTATAETTAIQRHSALRIASGGVFEQAYLIRA